jgi:hypothetical protein
MLLRDIGQVLGNPSSASARLKLNVDITGQYRLIDTPRTHSPAP